MAIAFGGQVSNSFTSATSYTISVTPSGANRLLLVSVAYAAGGTAVTDITYNGTSISPLVDFLDDTNVRHSMSYMVAPAASANNVVVTVFSAAIAVVSVAWYTGVDQINPFDGFNGGLNNGVSALSVSITTVNTNTWGVFSYSVGNAGSSTFGTYTSRSYQASGSTLSIRLYDSNASISVGTNTVTTGTPSVEQGITYIGLKEAAGTPVTNSNFLAFM